MKLFKMPKLKLNKNNAMILGIAGLALAASDNKSGGGTFTSTTGASSAPPATTPRGSGSGFVNLGAIDSGSGPRKTTISLSSDSGISISPPEKSGGIPGWLAGAPATNLANIAAGGITGPTSGDEAAAEMRAAGMAVTDLSLREYMTAQGTYTPRPIADFKAYMASRRVKRDV